ncbi:MAG: RNA polymerase sigma factor, partial [Candidatus Electryoneaceae bacterium]|nr:RNA polymerase sigma factor [Candidatus Electryoneaceae bacterium]
MNSFDEVQFFKNYVNHPERAFRLLMDEFRDKVFVSCLRATSRRQDAEDLTQDVFIRIWKGLPKFRRKSSLNTWIYHIAWNVCASYLKKKGRLPETVSYTEENDDDDHQWNLNLSVDDNRIKQFEKRQFIAKLFEALPETHRLVLTMFYLQEQSYAEISSITGWPLGTVKATLHRAKANL